MLARINQITERIYLQRETQLNSLLSEEAHACGLPRPAKFGEFVHSGIGKVVAMQTNVRLTALDSGTGYEARLPDLTHIHRKDVNDIIAKHIRHSASASRPIQILEAGCGRRWPFDLKDIEYTLTGVDTDQLALDSRRQQDLDIGILGDLRNVELPTSSFDVIYCSFVLEHVDGVEKVLNNFVSWLKPGGLLVLTFPNRDSVFGFFTRITPLWVHVLYKRYIKGNKNAGKAGFAPYPTFYDEIISRGHFHAFASEKCLSVSEERAFGEVPRTIRVFVKIVEALSLGKLTANNVSLMYILEKLEKDTEDSASPPTDVQPDRR